MASEYRTIIVATEAFYAKLLIQSNCSIDITKEREMPTSSTPILPIGTADVI